MGVAAALFSEIQGFVSGVCPMIKYHALVGVSERNKTPELNWQLLNALVTGGNVLMLQHFSVDLNLQSSRGIEYCLSVKT